MTEELKPCPFCGSNSIMNGMAQRGKDDKSSSYFQWCTHCFACGPYITDVCYDDCREKSRAAWNDRV